MMKKNEAGYRHGIFSWDFYQIPRELTQEMLTIGFDKMYFSRLIEHSRIAEGQSLNRKKEKTIYLVLYDEKSFNRSIIISL